MKPYPTYKDSGIEWIGEIPENWNIVKLKWLLQNQLKYGANESAELDDESCPRYIRITDFGDDGKLRKETFKSLPMEKAKEYLLCDGDVLFARSGATVGKTFLFNNYDGLACFAGYLIKATPNINHLNSEFLYLFTKSNPYDCWKNSIFIQATIQNIGADKYNILDIPIPPTKEQQSIVNFLNQKTSQIDTIIEKKQKQIELLKEERTAIINQAVTKGLNSDVPMKDSGIEWLGEIPEHWEIKKLKHLFQFLDSKRIPLSAEVRGDMEQIYDYYGASGVIDKVEDYLFDETLILIGEDGANLLSRSTPLAFLAKGKYWVNNHAHILKPKSGDINYFVNLLESIDYTTCISGSAQPKLTAESLGDVFVIKPPLAEQISITTYLDKQTSQIDTFIDNVQKQITLLQEYRTALISNAVTGKIDVRNENVMS